MQLFVNDLTVMDFSYLCPERGLVGESWIVDVLLNGGLDEQNMVLDFGHVKKLIKKTIDDIADHRLLVPIKSNVCVITKQQEHATVSFSSNKGRFFLDCPMEAFAFIDATQIGPETVTQFLKSALAEVLPQNINTIELNLRHEELSGAYYHYSHGLKKHKGNCQRIAHGHRSPLMIYKNGERINELEQSWAKRWRDIYLVTKEDCSDIDKLNINPDFVASNSSHYSIGYSAPQGIFKLLIPKACCEIIPHDTTVELLAGYIAKELLKIELDADYKVVAFEGVGKGAIAYS